MTWVKTSCNLLWLLGYEPQIIHSLDALPPTILQNLTGHLVDRLGPSFFSRLQFKKGQIIDLDEYYRQKSSDRPAKDTFPAYELAFTILFWTEGPVEYCAQISLDAQGLVLKEIVLPHIATHPERGEVVPLKDILDLAHSVGIPTNKAYLDMKYDQESDTLEYLVSYYVEEESHNLVILHVKAHDPTEYRWSTATVVSSRRLSKRPNHRLKQPAKAVTALAGACGDSVTGPGSARSAPASAAAYPGR
jgi:hypothetical protein